MSARARRRLDKREVAFELARICGHGAPMPEEREDDVDDRSTEDWQDTPPPAPDRRIQIGPLDVAAPR